MVAKAASSRAAGKGVASKATARKAATQPAVGKTASRTKAVEVKTTGPKTTKPTAASRKPAAPRKPTPRQALAITRKLLEQKQAHDRELQPWQRLDGQHAHVAEAGIQSNEAADKAVELHAGESRMKAIQGSAGTQGRRNQGKRDNR
ncbi:MAG: hypothetical protein EON92_03000 [Burkholderiales bacterium]|nr:MAG: hypothetical protein EON92_03000 [Burkholderiales bacterium]